MVQFETYLGRWFGSNASFDEKLFHMCWVLPALTPRFPWVQPVRGGEKAAT